VNKSFLLLTFLEPLRLCVKIIFNARSLRSLETQRHKENLFYPQIKAEKADQFLVFDFKTIRILFLFAAFAALR